MTSPDLVIGYHKLDTQFLNGHVRHTTFHSDASQGRRRVVVVKNWYRGRELGRGSFGTVFLERSEEGEQRAVKEIAKDKNSRITIDYRRELMAMAILAKHDALFVQLLGWYESDDYVHIAMEYISRGHLRNYLEVERSESEAKAVIRQLLEGLFVIHQEGFAHRDLKPENIFVVSTSPIWVKIGDFGLAKLAKDGTAFRTEGGTRDYVAPEVGIDTRRETSEYTNAIDIWALGCITHEMLTQAHPFQGLGELCSYCLRPELPKDIMLSKNISKSGIEFVERALAYPPERRIAAKEALDLEWLRPQDKGMAGLEKENVDKEIGEAIYMAQSTEVIKDLEGIPTGNDCLINKKADPAQGLYQTCVALREQLMLVPDFEKFLPDTAEDPVTQLWRCFRMGSSLCVLFNAIRPVSMIQNRRLKRNLGSANDCKAATYHFLQGIKKELNISDEDSFMIHNLYSDDTNGFVKVTRTVSKILDELKKRNLLLDKGPSGPNGNSSEQKPLGNRARMVQEFVDTERKYVQDLETLQEYMRALEADEVISKDLIHILFPNLNQLVDFQRRFLIRVETQNDLRPEQQTWGALFVEYCRDPEERPQNGGDPIGRPAFQVTFSVYQTYASNLRNAQDLAIEEKAKLERKPHPVYSQLNAFLIKPLQRVTKYPLLLRDMIKHTDPSEAEDQQLHQGLEAIEEIIKRIDEAIRRAENAEVVKDLEGRVEDWKGHKLENFGELLIHEQLVAKGDQKGDVEREYYIYLFERILVCYQEVGKDKKQNKSSGKPKLGKKRTMLQFKGRILMQNVTDVISLARGGSYTLQIFWRGDPCVEPFIIKHTNEEKLAQWNTALQRQRELFTKSETPGGNNGSRVSTTPRAAAVTEFPWMANADSNDEGRRSEDENSEYGGDGDGAVGHTPDGFGMPRNGSNTSLRSRAATNAGLHKDHHESHRLQRPSLPDMMLPNSVSFKQQNRKRSASNPNIRLPSQALLALARSLDEMAPPIPPVPPSYLGHSDGQAVINRSQGNSPISPNIPIQGAPVRNGSPAIQDIAPGNNGGMNGTSRSHSRIKLKVGYGSGTFIIIVPYSVSYSQLIDRIERKVRLPGSGPDILRSPSIKIRYLDEDGDYVAMYSDDDVRMAFDESGEPGQNGSAGITGVVTLSVS